MSMGEPADLDGTGGTSPGVSANGAATSGATSNGSASAAATIHADWQPLPERARLLFALERALPVALPALPLGFVLVHAAELPWQFVVALPPLAFLAGLWVGLRQFSAVAWRLDEEGLAIRRGRLWQRETRVPVTRVQHLDVKRGPWQRQRQLATVVVHTAGTRHSAVSVPHLDAADAERLRDVLGRQVDDVDEA